MVLIEEWDEESKGKVAGREEVDRRSGEVGRKDMFPQRPNRRAQEEATTPARRTPPVREKVNENERRGCEVAYHDNALRYWFL